MINEHNDDSISVATRTNVAKVKILLRVCCYIVVS
jgi:hypothetical protein